VSDNGNSWDCTTEVNAAGIGNAMEKAEAFLKKKNIDDKRVRNAILNLEETLGLLMEKNPGKTVLAECFPLPHYLLPRCFDPVQHKSAAESLSPMMILYIPLLKTYIVSHYF